MVRRGCSPNGPPPGPPYGPPPIYWDRKSYVPPVYVPPSGPLVTPPEVSPFETRFWLHGKSTSRVVDERRPAADAARDDRIAEQLDTRGRWARLANTQVLYGGENVDLGVASGWRLDLGSVAGP